MTEEVNTTAASTAAPSVADTTPVTSIPVAEVSATPSLVVTDAAPAAEAPATEATTSLLTEAAKQDTPVEAEKAPAPETKEGGQSDTSAQLPTFEDFKLPEGFAHDKEKLSGFMKDLGELAVTTKADQKIMQEFGQKLMDKYTAEVQTVIKTVQDQVQAAEKSKVAGWKAEMEKAADKAEVLKSAANALKVLPADLNKQFTKFVDETGMGNNPTLLRTLAAYEKVIADYKTKYESEAGIKPLAAQVAPEKPKGLANKMYGNMGK